MARKRWKLHVADIRCLPCFVNAITTRPPPPLNHIHLTHLNGHSQLASKLHINML